MTTAHRPPRGAFRPGMLLFDTRYRALTIQAVALLALMLLAAWLIDNVAQNLAALGKPIRFGFLTSSAQYDINQTLIAYDNQDSHLRAAAVGLLNTLFVAALACGLATVAGVLVGVLRLSRNWLVARLMAVYVEVFRNVPVLLWVVFFMAILIESLPPVAAFRGENAQAGMHLFGTVAFTSQGVFLPAPVGASLGWLLHAALGLSVLGVWLLRRRARMVQDRTGVRPATALWAALLLVVPVTLAFVGVSALTQSRTQAFIAAAPGPVASLPDLVKGGGRIDVCHDGGSAGSLNGMRHLRAEGFDFRRRDFFNAAAARRAFVVGQCTLLAVDSARAPAIAADLAAAVGTRFEVSVLPAAFAEGRAVEIDLPEVASTGIPRFEGGLLMRNSLIALWLALGFYTAAFTAETVRSGILAVSRGQAEAAAALGLRPGRTMRLVILPQALRVIIPPLISQYLNVIKNSSLAIAVGYMDITGTLGGITLNQTGRELECVLLLMLVYLAISLVVSAVMNWFNARAKLVER